MARKPQTQEQKEVKAAYDKVYRAANRQRILEQAHEYYATHKQEYADYAKENTERIRLRNQSEHSRKKNSERCRAYRTEHPDVIAAANKAWVLRNLEHVKGNNKRWREDHKDEIRAEHREYRENNKEYMAKRDRKNAAKRLYGLSVEEYESVLARGCEICGTTEGRMCLDHDHATGKVRGCLCFKCNLGLGQVERPDNWIQKAIDYLEEYGSHFPVNSAR